MTLSKNHEGDTKIKGEVLDKISYEVKESLTSIIGFSNIIKNSSLDSKQTEQINNVLLSSEKLLEFANNISDFSKLISGKYVTNHYTFSTDKLLNEIWQSFEPLIKKKKIKFQRSISEIKIKNDYQLTFQIIYGLLNYLIKLSSEGSSIFMKNNTAIKGVVIEIESNITDLIDKEKYQDSKSLLDCNDDYCKNLEFCLSHHLINLLGGNISFIDTEYNSTKIQIYLPNKLD